MLRTGFPVAPAPVAMKAGQTLKARLALANSGGQTAVITVAGALTQNGVTKYPFSSSSPVSLAPRQQAIVEMTVVPSSAGTYDVQWRAGEMQNGAFVYVYDEGVHQGVVTVTEVAAAVALPAFVGRVAYSPTSATKGQGISANVTLRNIGSGWLGGTLRGIIQQGGELRSAGCHLATRPAEDVYPNKRNAGAKY